VALDTPPADGAHVRDVSIDGASLTLGLRLDVP